MLSPEEVADRLATWLGEDRTITATQLRDLMWAIAMDAEVGKSIIQGARNIRRFEDEMRELKEKQAWSSVP